VPCDGDPDRDGTNGNTDSHIHSLEYANTDTYAHRYGDAHAGNANSHIHAKPHAYAMPWR
jgi:hypothetical protein